MSEREMVQDRSGYGPRCLWRACRKRATAMVTGKETIASGREYCQGHAEEELGRRVVVAAGLGWTLPAWMQRLSREQGRLL